MAVNSRAKGKRGELEAASVLRKLFGWTAYRSQQHSGTADSADLVVENTPDLWFEIKRVQRLNVPETMATASSQCGRRVPCLMHRRDRDTGWLLTIRLSDLPRVVHAFESSLSENTGNQTMVEAALPDEDAGASEGRSSRTAARPAWRLFAGRRQGVDKNHRRTKSGDD